MWHFASLSASLFLNAHVLYRSPHTAGWDLAQSSMARLKQSSPDFLAQIELQARHALNNKQGLAVQWPCNACTVCACKRRAGRSNGCNSQPTCTVLGSQWLVGFHSHTCLNKQKIKNIFALTPAVRHACQQKASRYGLRHFQWYSDSCMMAIQASCFWGRRRYLLRWIARAKLTW